MNLSLKELGLAILVASILTLLLGAIGGKVIGEVIGGAGVVAGVGMMLVARFRDRPT